MTGRHAELAMSIPAEELVLKRQLKACCVFALGAGLVVSGFYIQDRQREWALRVSEAQHRVDVAFEAISNETERVLADTLFLSEQSSLRSFVSGESSQRSHLQREFASFLRHKLIYDQIRLLSLDGLETVRVNFVDGAPIPIDVADLQDKSDRYYYRRARQLSPGGVFVSEFDLNLEHGRIEKPLKPVIRFAAPVADESGETKAFLVLNYLGGPLLERLKKASMPGLTILVRHDGQYLRAVEESDEWGWLLGHSRSFQAHFPTEWQRIDELSECSLTNNGAFLMRRISLGGEQSSHAESFNKDGSGLLTVVSFLPKDQVFASSRKMLWRLLLAVGLVFVPFAVLARYWAKATTTRDMHALEISESEERLRNLSSRLLRIQEDERRSISREIHDDLGQQVTAINLDLKLARRSLESSEALVHLDRALRENAGLLESLHNIAKQVRPAVLDDLGLRNAIESHLQEFCSRANIEVDEQLEFQSTEVSNVVADNVYRILQEALNNIAKHAKATKVVVKISIDKAMPTRDLHMVIHDNGAGFELDKGSSAHDGKGGSERLGLVGMQERVELLGGNIDVFSSDSQGTRIEVSLPQRSASGTGVENDA